MLVNEDHKVVYGSKTAGKTATTFVGKTWTLSKGTSQDDGLEEIDQGITDGKLPEWSIFLNMIRQGLNIADRGRILAENGVQPTAKAGVRALEQAIMVEATQHDLDKWVACVQRGSVAIQAYYDAMKSAMQELTSEPVNVASIPELFAQVLQEA